MKKVSLVLVAAMLLSAGSIFANDSKKEDKTSKKQNLSEQISSILNNDNGFTENHLGQEAEVLFMLNSDKEIVVLSVETDKENLEKFIKSKLNYQEVDVDNFKDGKKYTVAVRIAS